MVLKNNKHFSESHKYEPHGFAGGKDNQNHEDASSGEHECLHDVSWQSIQ